MSRTTAKNRPRLPSTNFNFLHAFSLGNYFFLLCRVFLFLWHDFLFLRRDFERLLRILRRVGMRRVIFILGRWYILFISCRLRFQYSSFSLSVCFFRVAFVCLSKHSLSFYLHRIDQSRLEIHVYRDYYRKHLSKFQTRSSDSITYIIYSYSMESSISMECALPSVELSECRTRIADHSRKIIIVFVPIFKPFS